ncbi:bolA-like protein 3 isoform X1 [Callorhinus ursinus]|uniref:BolA-like protein 3 n=3 Tax=Pinnipedia TaxID=3072905 RepID=A0A3Q7NR91_CALUR|nr:PREDICTED: bolA-like protein 3 isoform X1 [Odobenus rosmarus divergens]XP_025724160.1 bolA-like protein 3 isoform X1 [Callorhinus ursinus]XP_027478700.1 bolA-like protein 3 isoform X1 [Zalophus californianus]XP_027971927.1 bolA-like protein 3 isoform X1 [Eumetopias jubatus]
MAAWSPATAAPLLRGIRGLPLLHCVQRTFASQTEGELRVTQVLKERFPGATAIQVTDISGGCGAMYEIRIESEEFKEKRTVQQHQMVNQALKEEIKGMHGLRIFTSVPKH